MTHAESEKMMESANHLIGFFDQQVLASYRNEPDKYVLETDSFEGALTVSGAYFEELEALGKTDEWLSLRFGYRTLANGDLAIALWLPDLEKAIRHRERWIGFHIRDPTWTGDQDDRFVKWLQRYIEGSWDVDNGPKHHITDAMTTINRLTREMVDVPLFEHVVDAGVSFPAAENTHRYQDAHKGLYGYLIDGIRKECLSKLAMRFGVCDGLGSDRTIAAVMKVLPSLDFPSKFAQAMSLISEQRRIATHSVRPAATRFPAFAAFTSDLILLHEGLKELLGTLEAKFGVDACEARRRNEAKDRLPQLDKQTFKYASIHQALQMTGKTIEHVEYGQRREQQGLHASEGLVIYFSDGSILGIETGSNVRNITSSRSDLQPEEFHADLVLTWVPSLGKT